MLENEVHSLEGTWAVPTVYLSWVSTHVESVFYLCYESRVFSVFLPWSQCRTQCWERFGVYSGVVGGLGEGMCLPGRCLEHLAFHQSLTEPCVMSTGSLMQKGVSTILEQTMGNQGHQSSRGTGLD